MLNNRLGQSQRPSGRAENDFLPQELMVALRQSALPSEYLGPPGVTNINKLLRPMPPVKHLICMFILSDTSSLFPRPSLVVLIMPGIIPNNAKNIVIYWNKTLVHVEQDSELPCSTNSIRRSYLLVIFHSYVKRPLPLRHGINRINQLLNNERPIKVPFELFQLN